MARAVWGMGQPKEASPMTKIALTTQTAKAFFPETWRFFRGLVVMERVVRG